MKHYLIYLTVLALSLSTIFSCTNPIDAGSGLLDEDLVNVQSVDSFTISSETLPGDSLLVYSLPTNNSSGFIARYFFGQLDDPIMGASKVMIQSQLVPVIQAHPGLGITVDSLVLVLPYSSSFIYGDKTQRYDLEVRELADSFALDRNYFGNQQLPAKPNVFLTKSFAVKFDSITVADYSTGSTVNVKVPAQLRMRFDADGLPSRLLGIDTSIYRNRTKFVRDFYGLQLRSTNLGKALAAFDLSSSRAGLFLYFKSATGVLSQYRYTFGFIAANSIARDRGTSLLGKYLAGEPNQEYVLLQGQEGSKGKFSIPGIKNLKNIIVNKAELVVKVANVPDDEAVFFSPAQRLLAMYRNTNGRLNVVEDFNIGTQVSGGLDSYYRGTFVAGSNNEPGTYTINLTAHVQNMIKGKVPTDIYLKAFPLAESAARTTLYRANHPVHGAKLKLYYTQLGQ